MRFGFVIHLRMAKAPGPTVPQSPLARADEAIQRGLLRQHCRRTTRPTGPHAGRAGAPFVRDRLAMFPSASPVALAVPRGLAVEFPGGGECVAVHQATGEVRRGGVLGDRTVVT